MVHDARQRRRAWYGGAIVLVLVALAGFIFFLDDIIAQFERRYAVVVVMSRAPGLQYGSPVWIGGKEVGTVTAVGFLPHGADTLANVVVTVDLPRAARHHVRADSRVRLTATRLIGEPAIDVVPGTPTAPVLAPGDTLRQRQYVSRAELSLTAAAIRAQLDTTRRALQRLAPRMHARTQQTRRALAALAATIAQVRSLRSAVAASPNLSLLGDPAFLAALEHSRAQTAELARMIGVWREHTTETGEIRLAVERLQRHADSLRAQLDATAAALQAGNGSLGRAQRDSALSRAVEAARAELDSLIAETRRNPLRFIF
jgi:MlaD protein